MKHLLEAFKIIEDADAYFWFETTAGGCLRIVVRRGEGYVSTVVDLSCFFQENITFEHVITRIFIPMIEALDRLDAHNGPE